MRQNYSFEGSWIDYGYEWVSQKAYVVQEYEVFWG